jgi:hypothetical protein
MTKKNMKEKRAYLFLVFSFTFMFALSFVSADWTVDEPKCGDGVLQSAYQLNDVTIYEQCDCGGSSPWTIFDDNGCNAPNSPNSCSCKGHAQVSADNCACVCVPLAERNNEGSCECIDHSSYDEEMDSCYCDIGYHAEGSVCVHDYTELANTIRIGSGDSQLRDIICNSSIKNQILMAYGSYLIRYTLWDNLDPDNKRSFDIRFSYDKDSESYSIPLHTFSRILNKDSGILSCQAELFDAENLDSALSSAIADLNDIDLDSFSKIDGDCDDWPFDDGVSTSGSVCLLGNMPWENISITLIPKCFDDLNNDGIDDYASCSYCRNPGQAERADNVDNDCKGSCQAGYIREVEKPSFVGVLTKVIVPVKCQVSDYVGDGGIDNNNIIIYNSEVNLFAENVIGVDGCGGMKNEFGVRDDFCQMVDDGICGDSYDRAVIWGERKGEDLVITQPDPLYGTEGVQYNYFSFKPGQVDQDYLSERFSGTDGQNPNIFASLSVNSRCGVINVKEYGGGTIKIGPAMGLKIVLNSIYSVLPSVESLGNTRGTNLPGEYIDSVYGECNFTKFMNNPITGSKVLEKDQNGNFLWKWQTACVKKNKCNDGVNNIGPRSLFETKPYSSYLSKIKEFEIDYGEKGTQIFPFNSEFNVPLVDVDNPECKFNNPQNPNSQDMGGGLLKFNYDIFNYKINPQTDSPYCKDSDGDGFCGCVSKRVCPTDSARNSVINYARQNYPGLLLGLSQSGIFLDNGEPQYCIDVCDLSDKTYSISNQFPDCSDNLGNEFYTMNGQDRLATLPVMGWGLNLEDPLAGKSFTSWNVHPFASVTKTTCSLMNYDFNCNKNALKGYDMGSLLKGETPFDFDVEAGKENLAYGSDTQWWKQIAKDENRDAVCYEYPAYRDFAIETTLNVGLTFAGIGFGGLAAAGKTLGSTLTRQALVRNAVGLTFNAPLLWDTCKRQKNYALCLTQGGLVVMMSTLQGFSANSENIKKLKANSKTGGLIAETAEHRPPSIATKNEKVNAPTTPVPGCFLANTTIVLENGSLIDIQDIKEGDRVMAYDLENDMPVNASVTAFFVRNETKYRIIEYEVID